MPSAEDQQKRTLVVVGNGVASAVPDRCRIFASLRVTRESVADAIGDVASLSEAARTAIRDSGVNDGDVRTQDLQVQDWFDHDQQQVTARVATYTFTVEVRDLGEVSSLVGMLAATVGDALQIQSIAFSHSDHASLLAVARRAAITDALARAEELAEAAGVGIGDILTIEEGAGAGGGWSGYAVSTGARLGASAMPIEPGTQSVTARVAVTYALL